jgi:hypothetical protein
MKFELPEEKLEEFEKWRKEHECPYANNQGAIGGRLTYNFTPTSLGVICKVKCACGKEFDATDYEDW